MEFTTRIHECFPKMFQQLSTVCHLLEVINFVCLAKRAMHGNVLFSLVTIEVMNMGNGNAPERGRMARSGNLATDSLKF
jgi:hypothetical protein